MQEAHTALRIGELVRVRDDVWRIAEVQEHRGCEVLRLHGAGRLNRGVDRTFLIPFDRLARLAPSTRPLVARPRRLMRALAEAVAWYVPHGGLAAAAAARIDLYPHQLEPALALVQGRATRVLLADEVGLGKTIQAGLILAELISRSEVARALILTPAGLRLQWADELASHFRIDTVVADAHSLQSTAAALPRGINPWSCRGVFIASFDFVKRPSVLRSLDLLTWDLLIVDEAHAASGLSDRQAAIEGLAAQARRVVLLTATPHNGDDRAFASLCNLGRLGPPDEDPVVMFRRTRALVGLDAPRHARFLRITPTDAEYRMHRLLERYTRAVWREAGTRGDRDARLAMIVLRKRALSSAASLRASVDRRRLCLEEESTAPAQSSLPFDDDTVAEDDEPTAVMAARGLADRGKERAWLAALAAGARRAATRETKLGALTRLLRRTREPAIVFTEYRDTLSRLAAAIESVAAVATLHGGLSREARASALAAFDSGEARVLAATDAAAEGLNLQARCRWVITFELPWSPARLEQRVGRVDRIGQRRVVHATHLVSRDTAESLVIGRLMARVDRQRAALGASAGLVPTLPESAMAAAALGGAQVTGRELRRRARGDSTSYAAGLVVASSQTSESGAEVARLDLVRRLARVARAGDAPGISPAPRTDGPLVGVLHTRRGHGCGEPAALIALYAGAIVDPDGRILDAELAPVRVPVTSRPAPGSRVTAARVRALIESHLPELEDAARGHITTRLTTRLDTAARARAACAARLARREARLRDHAAAPLARRMVQVGLFDRRAARAAEAEHERIDARVCEANTRIEALRAGKEPCVGDIDLVVGLVL